MDAEAIQRLFVAAMSDEAFERRGSRLGVWDVSRGCEDPVKVTYASRATGLAKNLRKPGYRVPVIEMVLLTPCRSCPTCLKRHARLWAGRAASECEAGVRTWFGTLTLRPDVHVWIDQLCATRKRDFWTLPIGKKFAAQSEVLAQEITKYLKRVRKQSGARIRYLCVTEVHDGPSTSDFMRGRPHVHLLLHEGPGPQLTKSVLESQWRHGFTQFRLVNSSNHAAWYISKYVSKASEARTRASLGYGKLSR